jgi:hypothetical protein
VREYSEKAKVENVYETGGYAVNPINSITAAFDAGDHFFFNFTRGFFWSNQVDGQLEPLTYIGEDIAIPAHKILTFMIDCPSGDAVASEGYMVSGETLYGVFYSNVSDDFTPLSGGNFTFNTPETGLEGIIQRSGEYTFRAIALVPPSYKTATEGFKITEDPPRKMWLWLVNEVETQPYLVLLPVGITVASLGAVVCVWATIAKVERRSRKTVRR